MNTATTTLPASPDSVSRTNSVSTHNDTTNPTSRLEQPVARSQVKEFFANRGTDALFVCQILTWVTLAAVIIPFVMFFYNGQHVDRVLTGSMEPTIKTGELIVLRSVQGDDLRVGQIVQVDHGTYSVTHRVISVDDKGTEDRSDDTATTQGDANNAADLFQPTQKDLVGVLDHQMNEKVEPLLSSFSVTPQYVNEIMQGRATPVSIATGAPWGLILWSGALILFIWIIPSGIERHRERRAQREAAPSLEAVNVFASKE